MSIANPHGSPKPPAPLDRASREFMLWLLRALGLHVHATADGVYEIESPLSAGHDPAAGAERPYAAIHGLRFVFDERPLQDAASSPALERASWQSPLGRWLLAELEQGGRPIHAAAAHQPLSVHELADHLFAQYKVDNGHMRLAGCSLEDRPFLRLSYLRLSPAESEPELVHCFGNSDGTLVSRDLKESLDLNNLVPLAPRAPRIDDQLVRRWTQLIRRQCEQQDRDRARSLVAATLVWCKHAEGKLTFSIGQASAEVTFSGWGRLFSSRRCLPPPYKCHLSGRSSYHLSATDDGHITVAEAIASCAESSRKVLESELRVCEATDCRVLPEFLRECPCTGMHVRASVLHTCSLCQQQVSPRAIVDNRCTACRQLKKVTGTNTDLACILSTYPKLGRLGSWKMSQSRNAWILIGRSPWKRLLLVVHKQTAEILHMAVGKRFSRVWNPLSETERREWLC